MSEPVPRLDSRKLSCLQHMGITVWQRRAATTDAENSPAQYSTSETTVTSKATIAATARAADRADTGLNPLPVEEPAVAAAAVVSEVPAVVVSDVPVVATTAQPLRSNVLLQMPIEVAAADTSIKQATVVIARASLPAAPASPLVADEYQLLRKMMESIGIQAGHWIAVSEIAATRGATSAAGPVKTLADLLFSCDADALLLLLPATELTRANDYWTEFRQNLEQSQAGQTTLTISVAGRSVVIAPLCDPQDLLQNGALKRDAWECLKTVRAHLSRAQKATTVG